MTNISYTKNKVFAYNFATFIPYIETNFYFNVRNVVSIELNTDIGLGVWESTEFVWPVYYIKTLKILNKGEPENVDHLKYADLYNLYDPAFDIESLKLS